MSRIITLTTDFGTKDAYVGAMKGVILRICPDARLVDISHDIAPQDVMEAAYVLRDAAFLYPLDTVHLVVVDPGVGTDRFPVAIRAAGYHFVGPDNGIFPLLLGDPEPEAAVILDRVKYWRTDQISTSFHGRDIFAPAAAHLSKGEPLCELGRTLERLTPMHWALPMSDDQGLQGWVVHVDHFGNCVTNVSSKMLDERRAGRPIKCFVGNAILDGISRTYGAVDSGEPLIHINSSDFLEIAVRAGNASELLGIRKGDPVNILFREQK